MEKETILVPGGSDHASSSSGSSGNDLGAQDQFTMRVNIPSTTSTSTAFSRVQITNANNGNNFCTSSLCLTIPNASIVNMTCPNPTPQSQSNLMQAVTSSSPISLPLFTAGNSGQVHSLFYEAPCVRVSQGTTQRQDLHPHQYSSLFSNNSQVAQQSSANVEHPLQGPSNPASSLFKNSNTPFNSNANPPQQTLPQCFDSADRVLYPSRSSSSHALTSSWSSKIPLTGGTSQNMLQTAAISTAATENSALLKGIPLHSTVQGFQDNNVQELGQKQMLPSVSQTCFQNSNAQSLSKFSVSNIPLSSQTGGNSSTSSSIPIISNQNLVGLSNIVAEQPGISEALCSTLASSCVGSSPSGRNYASSSASACPDALPSAEVINRPSNGSEASSSSRLFSVTGQSNSTLGLPSRCTNSSFQAPVSTLANGLSGNPVPSRNNELQSMAGSSSALGISNFSSVFSAPGSSNFASRSTVSRASSALRLPSISRHSSVASSSQRPGSFNCSIASTSRDVFGIDAHVYGNNDVESNEAYPVILAEPPARTIASGDLGQRSLSPGAECLVSSSTERGGVEADGRGDILDSHPTPSLPLLDSTVDSTGDPTPLDCLDNSDQEFSRSPTLINSPYSYEADSGLIQSSQYEPSSGIAMNSLKNIYLTSFSGKSHDFYSSSDDEDEPLANFAASRSFIPSLSGGKGSSRMGTHYLFGQRKSSGQATNSGKSVVDQVVEVESPGVACSEDSIGEMASSYELGLSGSLPHSGRDPLARGGSLLQLPDQILEHQQHLLLSAKDVATRVEDVASEIDGDCQSTSIGDHGPSVPEPRPGPSGYKPKKVSELQKGHQNLHAESTSVTTATAAVVEAAADEGLHNPYSADEGLRNPCAPDEGLCNPCAPDEGLCNPCAPDEGLHKPCSADEALHNPCSADKGLHKPFSADEGLPNPCSADEGLPNPCGPDEGLPNPCGPNEGLSNPCGPDEGLSNPCGPDASIIDCGGIAIVNQEAASASHSTEALQQYSSSRDTSVSVPNFSQAGTKSCSLLPQKMSSSLDQFGCALQSSVLSVASSSPKKSSGVVAGKLVDVKNEEVLCSAHLLDLSQLDEHFPSPGNFLAHAQSRAVTYSNSSSNKVSAAFDEIFSDAICSNSTSFREKDSLNYLDMNPPHCTQASSAQTSCQNFPGSKSGAETPATHSIQLAVSNNVCSPRQRDVTLSGDDLFGSPCLTLQTQAGQCLTMPVTVSEVKSYPSQMILPQFVDHHTMDPNLREVVMQESTVKAEECKTTPSPVACHEVAFESSNFLQGHENLNLVSETLPVNGGSLSLNFSGVNVQALQTELSDSVNFSCSAPLATSEFALHNTVSPVKTSSDEATQKSNSLFSTSMSAVSPVQCSVSFSTDHGPGSSSPMITHVTTTSLSVVPPAATMVLLADNTTTQASALECAVPAQYFSEAPSVACDVTGSFKEEQTCAKYSSLNSDKTDSPTPYSRASDFFERLETKDEKQSPFNTKTGHENASPLVNSHSSQTQECCPENVPGTVTSRALSVEIDETQANGLCSSNHVTSVKAEHNAPDSAVLLPEGKDRCDIPQPPAVKRPRRSRSRLARGSRCRSCTEGSCPQHSTEGTVPELHSISDRVVRSYAWESLPSSHLSIRKLDSSCSSQGRYGVFSKGRLMRNTIFGPMKGVPQDRPPETVSSEQEVQHPDGLSSGGTSTCNGGATKAPPGDRPLSEPLLLPFTDADGELRYLDTSDADQSNWMRFVARATDARHVTCRVVERGPGALYFLATCDVTAGTELRVAYSEEYALSYGLPLLQLSPQQLQEDEDEQSWPCYECDARLPSSQLLQQHLVSHDGLLEKGKKKLKSKRGRQSKKTSRSDAAPSHSVLASSFANQDTSHHVKDASHPDQDGSYLPGNTSHPDDSSPHPDQNTSSPNQVTCSPDHALSHPNLAPAAKKTASALGGSGQREQHSAAREGVQEAGASTLGVQLRCLVCKKTFTNVQVFSVHQLCHNSLLLQQEEEAAGAARTTCPQCEVDCGSLQGLLQHLDSHALPTPPKKGGVKRRRALALGREGSNRHGPGGASNAAAEGCSSDGPSSTTQYACPICSTKFTSLLEHKAHLKTHRDSQGLYHCPKCAKSFDAFKKVRRHIRAYCSEQLTCPECGRTQPSAVKLRIHMLTHSDRRDFKCGACPSSFKRKDKLKEHERRMHCRPQGGGGHPGGGRLLKARARVPVSYLDRPYHCKMCQLGFKRRGMLVNHVLKCHPLVPIESVQDLNKPLPNPRRIYKCIYCHKVYQSNPRRNQHIKKVHPGKALVNSNSAVELAKVTSDPSDCSADAGPAAGDDDNNNSGPRYAARCQWCKREYMTRAKLYQHMRRSHPATTTTDTEIPETSDQRAIHDGLKLENQRVVNTIESQPLLLELSHGDGVQQTKISLPRTSFVHTTAASHVASSFSSSSLTSSDVKSYSGQPWSDGVSFASSLVTEESVKPSSDLLTQAMCAAITPDASHNMGTRSVPVHIVDMSQLARSDYGEPIYLNNGDALTSSGVIQTVVVPDGRECEPVSIVMPKAEEETLMTFELYAPDTGETYRLQLPPGHVLHLAPAATAVGLPSSNSGVVPAAQNL